MTRAARAAGRVRQASSRRSCSLTPHAAPISRGVVVGEDLTKPCPAPRRQCVVAAEQRQPVRPCQVGAPAAAVVSVPGDPAADCGEHVVAELDQVEVVHADRRFRQPLRDRSLFKISV